MKKGLLAAAVVLLVSLALLLRTFTASPLPAPEPYVGSLPPASSPSGMAVFQLPTGVAHRNAAFAYRGGSFRDKRDFSMSAVLVKHPRGDLLIDTGFGRDIDRQFATLPFLLRIATSYDHTSSAADLLKKAGYDRKNLRAILLTHAHWDHVSGIPDFPGTPVWVTAEERRFIYDGGVTTGLARSFRDVKLQEYSFEDVPYLGFPRSLDLYRDGSIVIVPTPGHTPGSVIIFLALPDGKRYAMVGDLVWQNEGISLREERPWLTRSAADADAEGVRRNILHVAAIAAKFPEITIVPAHDQRGYAQMPKL